MKLRTVDKLMCNDAVRFSLRARRLLQRCLKIYMFSFPFYDVFAPLCLIQYIVVGRVRTKCISAFSSITYESIEKDDYGCYAVARLMTSRSPNPDNHD